MAEFIEELPDPRQRDHRVATDLLAFADELRAKPGQWARWPRPYKSAYSTSNNIRRGNYKALPPEKFGSSVRGGVLYVRYDE